MNYLFGSGVVRTTGEQCLIGLGFESPNFVGNINKYSDTHTLNPTQVDLARRRLE